MDNKSIPKLGSLLVIKKGEILWNNLENIPRKTKKDLKEVRFKAPTRLNFGILDFTEMRPNIPGTHCNSGSMGFGVKLYSTVNLSLTDNPNIIIAGLPSIKAKDLLEHVALIMKNLTDYKGGFRISAEPINYPHVGLGSTAALSCALYNAINIALGSPFSDRELVKIGAFNYVEEGPGGKLYPGQSTGMSGWIAQKGGICIVTSEAELVLRENIPKDYKAVVGLPKVKGKGIADSEKELPDLDKFYLYDRFNSARMCHWTLMRLIPAIKSRNYKEVGNITWDMLANSCKGVGSIILRESSEILKILIELRKAGGEICFISSVGPAIATLVPSGFVGNVVKVYKKYNQKVLELEIDNQGGQII
jgi:predicted sugar kinase